MEFRIVDAAVEHIPQLAALEEQCFSMPWTAQTLQTQLKDKQHEFIVALSGDEILGYVGMMYVLDEGYISNVAVSPGCRRQGIADALITELLNIGHKLELSFITLEVREHNEAAISLYAKHGFRPVGRRKAYYQQPTEDAVLMTKILK